MATAKKSSNAPKIIIIVVILLLLGVGAYFVLGNGKNSMMGSAVNKITSAKDMLTASVSMHCEYTEGGINSKVDIKNGAIRLDTTGSIEEQNGSIIIKDQKMYIWNASKEGYVYDVPDEESADGTGETKDSQKEDLMKSLEEYKDACKPGVVSDSLFNPPSDVTFTDMNSMMKQNTGEMMKYQQQYAPSGDESDTASDEQY